MYYTFEENPFFSMHGRKSKIKNKRMTKSFTESIFQNFIFFLFQVRNSAFYLISLVKYMFRVVSTCMTVYICVYSVHEKNKK